MSLNKDPYNHNHIMLWAACCLVFFVFLRSGELTVPNTSTIDLTWHLTLQGIMVDDKLKPTCLFIRVKGLKMDQTRQGITLCVGRTYNELCPVAAVLAFMARQTTYKGPLFVLASGQPLTRQKLVDFIKQAIQQAGIDLSNYTGHSFRIGAATTAAANGIGDATIQTLGTGQMVK